MSLRTDAVNHVSHGKVQAPEIKGAKITGVFGENVFTLKTAREYLSDEAYKSLLASVRGGKNRSSGSRSDCFWNACMGRK